MKIELTKLHHMSFPLPFYLFAWYCDYFWLTVFVSFALVWAMVIEITFFRTMKGWRKWLLAGLGVVTLLAFAANVIAVMISYDLTTLGV